MSYSVELTFNSDQGESPNFYGNSDWIRNISGSSYIYNSTTDIISITNNDLISGNTGLISAIFNVSATEIDGEAFRNCTSLASISLPSVKTISYNAFENCTALASITLPSVQTISYGAFNTCTALASISLPTSLTTISDYAFESCTALASITLPSVQTISYATFYRCTSLASISLPSVKTISDFAFYYCTALASITLPSVQTIRYGAFNRCTSLASISLPTSLTTIGDTAFESCTALASITLPSVQTISYSAFYDCNALTSISLPSVKTISDYAFYRCTSLASISLPSVQTIGDSAFYDCNALTSISLPTSLTTIGDSAFESCTALASITLPSVQTIHDNAFKTCTALTSITIPSVQTILYNAFQDCNALTSITLPSLTTIDDDSFYDCSSLANVYFTSSTDQPTSFSSSAFPDNSPEINMYYYSGFSSFYTPYLNTQTYITGIPFNILNSSISYSINVKSCTITFPKVLTTSTNNVYYIIYNKNTPLIPIYSFNGSQITSYTITNLSSGTKYTFIMSVYLTDPDTDASTKTESGIPINFTTIIEVPINNSDIIYPSFFYSNQPYRVIYRYQITGNQYVIQNLDNVNCSDIIIGNSLSNQLIFTNVNISAGLHVLTIVDLTTGFILATFDVDVPAVCFKEGTKILCRLSRTEEKYVPIEKIKDNMYVKTYKHGYKRAKFIVKNEIYNSSKITINKLYRMKKTKENKLLEDLYITGSHAVLYDTISGINQFKMNKLIDKMELDYEYKIDDKYKLIAYFDNNFEEVKEEGYVNIYHLVLENNHKKLNYGIYANGILVESSDEISQARNNNYNNDSIINYGNKMHDNQKIVFNINPNVHISSKMEKYIKRKLYEDANKEEIIKAKGKKYNKIGLIENKNEENEKRYTQKIKNNIKHNMTYKRIFQSAL